jgi:hypothetical protein
MVRRGPGIAPFAGGKAPTSTQIPRAGVDNQTFSGRGVGFGHHDTPQVGPYAGGKLTSPVKQATKKRFSGAADVDWA